MTVRRLRACRHAGGRRLRSLARRCWRRQTANRRSPCRRAADAARTSRRTDDAPLGAAGTSRSSQRRSPKPPGLPGVAGRAATCTAGSCALGQRAGESRRAGAGAARPRVMPRGLLVPGVRAGAAPATNTHRYSSATITLPAIAAVPPLAHRWPRARRAELLAPAMRPWCAGSAEVDGIRRAGGRRCRIRRSEPGRAPRRSWSAEALRTPTTTRRHARSADVAEDQRLRPHVRRRLRRRWSRPLQAASREAARVRWRRTRGAVTAARTRGCARAAAEKEKCVSR